MKVQLLAFCIVFLCAFTHVHGQTKLVSYGAEWKYLVTGTDQGTAWRQTSYNDGAWATGITHMGYGDGDEATVIGYGPDPNNKYITTYFRKTITVTNPSAFSTIVGNIKRDDGAIVYINGTEVFRSNLGTGTIVWGTLASNADDDGYAAQPFSFSPSLLINGTNVIAVEIHQLNATSTDLSFDFDLEGTTGSTNSGTTWSLSGNSGSSASANFLGTTDGQPLIVKTNNTEAFRVTTTGQIGVGTGSATPSFSDQSFKLLVNSGIRARKVKVDQASWADYVFEPTYKLPALKEVEAFIKQHRHLPDVPSAKEVEQNGLDVGDNQAVLLKKIEELTLYAIDADKELKRQSELIGELQSRVVAIKKDQKTTKISQK